MNQNTQTPVGRFAPTPSGRMHMGNLFSALLAWLSVRSQNGQMVLRMEDIDTQRTSSEFADQLRRDLEWLGLTWDWETPPQSQRTQAYLEVFEKLKAMDLIYPCYCTRSRLHAIDAPHGTDGTYIYDRRCRYLTESQRAAFGRSPSWRLKVPNLNISFTDLLQGFYEENLEQDCGDFVVRRADDVFVYQLAVVTDDAAAGVTQVVRGRDLLSCVPRQMYLQSLLGYSHPEYAHVPMLLSKDGRRLSKRDRDMDLDALRQTMSREEILGRLAYWAGLLTEDRPADLPELIALFSWNRITRTDIYAENLEKI